MRTIRKEWERHLRLTEKHHRALVQRLVAERRRQQRRRLWSTLWPWAVHGLSAVRTRARVGDMYPPVWITHGRESPFDPPPTVLDGVCSVQAAGVVEPAEGVPTHSILEEETRCE